MTKREWLEHELHVIEVKMFMGVLKRPEDTYMWPEIERVARELGWDD